MAANESASCLFCAIIKGTVPSHKVYEDEHSLAFLDIMPTTEGHTQVIPKYHAETLADLPDEYLREIGPVIKKVALATGVEQYNVVQNNGKLAFQHIPHVHFHVIPKPNETEGLVLTLGQNWLQKKAENDDLAATCAKMKGRL
ncbi:HIT-like domain-containing protein [Mycena rebaudengoi]|nr:HIT-like domain-containing protein [Mycena rebaudengoi]